MKTILYCYTGTGNSLWIARVLAAELGGAEIIPMVCHAAGATASRADAVGIIFPVHIWGLPRRVVSFTDQLANGRAPYLFAVAVHAGQVAATLIQLEKRIKAGGSTLSLGFEIAMPSNYIPWGGPGPQEKQIRRFEAAREKIGRIAAAVSAGEIRPVEKGPLWQNLLFTPINRLCFPYVPKMDRSFRVDETCDGCGVCVAVCPCSNIGLQAGRPVWRHRCEQCLSCIQWCPRKAIQYGKRTQRYERYHHPEVALGEMIAARRDGTGDGESVGDHRGAGRVPSPGRETPKFT